MSSPDCPSYIQQNQEDIISQIKENSDCREMFEDYWPEKYKEQGNSQCPFHDDRNPSLQVLEDHVFCHSGCGKKDAIDLYALKHAMSNGDAIRAMKRELGLDRKPPCIDQPEPNLNRVAPSESSLPQAAIDYFKNRGITSIPENILNDISFFKAGNDTVGKDSLAFKLTDYERTTQLGTQYMDISNNSKRFGAGDKLNQAFFRLKGKGPVVVTEGIIDALSVSMVIPDAHVCSAMSANSTEKLKCLRECIEKPILFFDNDKAGAKATKKAIEILDGHCCVVDWSLAPGDVKDPNDLLMRGETEIIRQMITGALPASADPSAKGNSRGSKRHETSIFNAADLQQMSLPEPQWLVPDFLPQGVTMLAGKPKMGKSYMVLSLALALSSGEKLFGQYDVEKQGVLYLCLEDNERRLRSRIDDLFASEAQWPENFHMSTKWPKVGQGGLEALREWFRQNPDVKLLIVDTFAKIKETGRRSQNAYESDYEHIGNLKEMTDELGISLLLVHHLRKMEATDPFDTISGSTGLTGAVDTGMVLMKTQGKAVLYIRGRDIQEKELALERDLSGGWRVLGNVESHTRSKEQEELLRVIIGHGSPVSPKELSEITKKTPQNVCNMLKKLMDDGAIEKTGHGKYAPSVNDVFDVSSVNNVCSVDPQEEDTSVLGSTSISNLYIENQSVTFSSDTGETDRFTSNTPSTLQSTDLENDDKENIDDLSPHPSAVHSSFHPPTELPISPDA